MHFIQYFSGRYSARQRSECARFHFHALPPPHPQCQSMKEHRNKLFIVLCAQQRPPNFRERKLQQRKHLLNLTSLLTALLCICSDSLKVENIEQQKQRYRPLVGSVNLDGNITNCSGAVLNTISSHLLYNTHNDTFVLCKIKEINNNNIWLCSPCSQIRAAVSRCCS